MLRLLEGFDFYGPSGRTDTGLDADIDIRHEGGSILFSTDGDLIDGRGGHDESLRFSYDSNNKVCIARYDPGQSDTWIIGFAYKTPDTFEAVQRKILEVHLGHAFIWICKGCPVIDTAGAGYYGVDYSFKTNRWYYIELKIYHHNSSGTLELRINGQTVYSDTGLDTLNGSNVPAGAFLLHSAEDRAAFDDLYICDGSGSYNNDFLGLVKVETLRPTGDNGSQNWTPSIGGDHYALVDNANMWDASDYIEANGANIDDLWSYADLTKINGTIHGIQLVTSAWTDSGMPQIIQAICDSGSTVDYAAVRGVGVDNDPVPYEAIWETDPDTSSAWTANGINGASFGVRKV